ncbi:MAG: 6-phospho-beta-glucosidase, partial [Bacilli bacterium]
LPFLKPDVSIETSCIITSGGPIPLATKPLHPRIEAEIASLKAFESLAIEAIVTNDYQKALTALNMNPLILKGHLMEEVFNEVIAVNKLPFK